MIPTVLVLTVTHALEVVVWAFAYFMVDAAPEGADRVYFAFVNYTTLGYGDVIPVARWRLLGPLDGDERRPDVRMVHGGYLRNPAQVIPRTGATCPRGLVIFGERVSGNRTRKTAQRADSESLSRRGHAARPTSDIVV